MRTLTLPLFLRRFSTLQLALALSVAVHAALLTLRLADPAAFNRIFEDTPLEVVLVNARGNERPELAQAIAQANLAGGGDADKGRAASPLPPSLLDASGDQNEEERQRQLQALREQQNLMLAQVRHQLAALPPAPNPQAGLTPEETERELKRRQLVKLLAEIERRIRHENARPRKRYISPATREAV